MKPYKCGHGIPRNRTCLSCIRERHERMKAAEQQCLRCKRPHTDGRFCDMHRALAKSHAKAYGRRLYYTREGWKRARYCSGCGREGHQVSTCPQLDAERAMLRRASR